MRVGIAIVVVTAAITMGLLFFRRDTGAPSTDRIDVPSTVVVSRAETVPSPAAKVPVAAKTPDFDALAANTREVAADDEAKAHALGERLDNAARQDPEGFRRAVEERFRRADRVKPGELFFFADTWIRTATEADAASLAVWLAPQTSAEKARGSDRTANDLVRSFLLERLAQAPPKDAELRRKLVAPLEDIANDDGDPALAVGARAALDAFGSAY